MLSVVLIFVASRLLFLSPTNELAWRPQHEKMPYAEFDSNLVHIKNIRNFSYGPGDEFIPAYYDQTYDLDKIESLWFCVAPFAPGWRGPAHTFASFGFADSQYLSVSVEARKEPDEDYSIVMGMLNKFELLYVIGDERDIIGSRAVYSDDDVFLYPIKATKQKIKSFFVDALNRANKLRDEPEFYNTLTSNCTTNIFDHAKKINPEKWPFSWHYLLPGYADELLYDKGVLATELSLEEARINFKINDRARAYIDSEEFSASIRDVSKIAIK